MNKPFATSEEYRAAVLRLGDMARTCESADELGELYGDICENGKGGDFFPAFGIMRDALSLTPAEAMCVALGLYHETAPVPALTARELLERHRLLAGGPPRKRFARLFIARGGEVALHPVVTDFLLEREPGLPDGISFLPLHKGDALHTEPLLEELGVFLERYASEDAHIPVLIAICGGPGSGRRFVVSRLADKIGGCALLIDIAKRPETEDIILTAELYGAVVCIKYPADGERVAMLLDRLGFAFALCGSGEKLPECSEYAVLRRDMPPPTAGDRMKLLTDGSGDIISAQTDADCLAVLGRMTPGQIKALAGRLRAERTAAGSAVGKDAFLRLLREHHDVEPDGVMRLESADTLDDLVLPEEQKRQLTELCAFIKMRDTVYKVWGFARKAPWGRGLALLFYGSPGTGKTMAAAVMANEAGLPLWRVDISHMISKYIGETQKNIGKIFDEAAKSDCILFFDEADALFSRRSEAADAQDKYSNSETAYLLQRMEGYDGICILATNLLQNFDEAFRRRIGYMLHFPQPDEALRERIWRGIFPEEAPIGEIDYQLLARQLELTGASIKSCAVHAAYLAAINGEMITMPYIFAGIKNEYAKLGKALSPQLARMMSC